MSKNSWEEINKNTVIKNLDYSTFKHRTTTIPIGIYEFFNLNAEDSSKAYVNLVVSDTLVFPAYVRHADKSRTTPAKLLCWNMELDKYLKKKYPQWNTITSFTRTDAFKLTFTKTDKKNEFKIDTNEESYLENLIFTKVIDNLDDSLSSVKKNTPVSTVPVEYNDSDIEIAGKAATLRTRKELKMQNRFIDILKANGYQAHSSQVDVIAVKSNERIFIEAKILSSETKAAQALGQLLYYKHSVKKSDKPTKLILLFDRKPKNNTIDFLKKFKIDQIVYEDKKKFKSIYISKNSNIINYS